MNRIIWCSILMAFAFPLGAQEMGKISPDRLIRPLQTVLNPDGTIKSTGGYHGALDPDGYSMVTGPGGAPVFTRPGDVTLPVPADSSWDGRFAAPGIDGELFCVLLHGDSMYVGGQFDRVGAIAANNIALWDGSEWSPLGSGTNARVNAIIQDGTDLIVGGNFSTAGGNPAAAIARWDGAAWSSIGSGMTGGGARVDALLRAGSDIYAAGNFALAGGVNAPGIARWDGSAWNALGSGTIWEISALASIGTDLYAGGYFDDIGGVTTASIARWDGAAWHALGSGLAISGGWRPTVRALAAVGSDLYVTGIFDSAGGISVSHVAKWNGTTWSALGSGLDAGGYGIVAEGGDIVVGGEFSNAGGTPASYIAEWNGTTWAALGSGLGGDGVIYSGKVRTLAFDAGRLVAAGTFTSAGGTGVAGIALWSGGTWSGIGGFDQNHGMHWNGGSVYGLTSNGADLYVGGRFVLAGQTVGKRLAKWNGSGWSAVGNGVTETQGDAYVRTVAVNGGDVYIGGTFPPVTSSWYVEHWNGGSWLGFTGFPDLPVHAMAVVGSDVYVGGEFQHVDGVPIAGIARWDGSSWHSLGSGLTGPGFALVYDIAVKDTVVYVAGLFSNAGGVSANNIAKWDGHAWSAAGSLISTGYPEYLDAVKLVGDTVYVGGECASLNNIGRSTGGAWTALGAGTNGPVTSLAVQGTDVYAGGSFTTAGGGSASHIAKWNGVSWSALGSGTDLTVQALAVQGPDLWAGGDFTTAGSKASSYIARWHLQVPYFSVSPGSLHLGYVPPGSDRHDSLLVTNTGLLPLTISSIATSDAELTVNPPGGTIAPSESRWFDVTFSPSGYYIDRTDTITFHHDGSAQPDRVVCSATGVETVTDTSAAGWNLLSVPMHVPDYSKTAVYPAATLPAYGYSGSYVKRDTLRNGEGYWVRFDAPEQIQYAGGISAAETVTVVKGWNIIGSLSGPLSVTSIGSVPGGIVASQFFGYSGVYAGADTIRPGRGYWVKVGTDGLLILSSAGDVPFTGRIRVVPSDETPPVPPIGDFPGGSSAATPAGFALGQNYPNPFNPVTVVRYQLPQAEWVTLKVYDALGREVATLVDGMQEAGFEAVAFDAESLASGVYTYRLVAGRFVASKKMMIVK